MDETTLFWQNTNITFKNLKYKRQNKLFTVW